MIHVSQALTLTKLTRMHLRPVSNPDVGLLSWFPRSW